MVEPKEVEDDDEEAAVETRRRGGGGGGGRDVERASPHPTSLVLDDSGRIRLLHPSRPISLREICRASSSFRSKITQFHQASKRVVDRVLEEAQKVDEVKQKAIESRCSVAVEIATRPHKLADQRWDLEQLREKLENLNVEYESLEVVKHEQEMLLARLTHSHGPS